MRLADRASARFYLGHRWQALLTLMGILMGVAVVVAVDLANESARRALSLSVDALTGSATHRIHGGPGGVPESLLTRLRLDGVHNSAPVISDYIRIGDGSYTLMGVDPVSEIALARYRLGLTPGVTMTGDIGTLLTETSVVLPETLARSQGLTVGDILTLDYRGRGHAVRVAAVVGGGDGGLPQGLVLTDIAAAQQLLERNGVLDRIDLLLDEGQASRLTGALPDGVHLVAAETQDASLREMTATFHLNLTAMSLLALLVGGLLIYNTMAFAVLRRRDTWGIYRQVGMTRGELIGGILREALLLALVGTALGLVAGLLLARWLLDLVLGTVDDLFFALTVREFTLAPLSLVKGLVLGVGVTLLASLMPALEAAATRPAAVLGRHALEHGVRRLLPLVSGAGVMLMLAGAWLTTRPGGLTSGFVALAMLVLGFCALVPAVLLAVGRAPLPRWTGTVFRLLLRGVATGLSRTGLATAALCVAVAATVSMGVMVGSFRHSLDNWLAQTLSGDIYISEPGRVAANPGPGLPEDLVAQLSALPGLRAVERHRLVRIDSAAGNLPLLAVDALAVGPGGSAVEDHLLETVTGPLLLSRVDDNALARFGRGEGVLVSEPLAWHQGLSPGENLSLQAGDGTRELPVLGVFRDYRSTQGMVVVSLGLYRDLWGDHGISALALHGDGSRTDQQLLADARQRVADQPVQLVVESSASLRERSLAIFDQTFAVTQVLRLLTVVVAFVAVLGALMQLQLERRRELALLRATGVTQGQSAALILGQTGVMGLMAGLLALPLGLLMAEVLIHVINRRAFGWTLTPLISSGPLLHAILLALVAALLAGCYPAWRAARLSPAQGLRDE